MLKVYVAGKYNGANVIEILANMRAGILLSAKVMQAGFAPFCPWLDFQIGLTCEFTVEQYKACSMAWVGVCDVMLLVPGWENSGGAKAEIEEANRYHIPVFESLELLITWSNQ